MPWRARYIESRRHPLALACYGMSGLLGLCFLFNLFQSPATSNVTTSGWQLAWEWELALGGVIGFLGAVWPAVQHLDDALNAEALGSMLGAVGFATWAFTSAVQSDWASPASLVFIVIALGFAFRTWQAARDRKRWIAVTREIAKESRE